MDKKYALVMDETERSIVLDALAAFRKSTTEEATEPRKEVAEMLHTTLSKQNPDPK